VCKKTTTANHGKTAPPPLPPPPQRSRAVQPQLRDLLVLVVVFGQKPLTHRFRLGKIIDVRLEIPLGSHVGGAFQGSLLVGLHEQDAQLLQFLLIATILLVALSFQITLIQVEPILVRKEWILESIPIVDAHKFHIGIIIVIVLIVGIEVTLSLRGVGHIRVSLI